MIITRIQKRVLLLVIALALLLSACTPEPAEPTPDVEAIYTAAAETVQADLTRVALLTPSATATATPTQTATPTPTQDVAALTLTPLISLPAISTPLPPAAPASPDRYEVLIAGLTGEGVDDGATKISLDKKNVDLVWEVKNTGTTTWKADYYIQHFVWDRLGTQNIVKFGKEVKPNETIRLLVDMNMPNKAGKYRTWWKMKRADATNFGDLYLDIEVVAPGPTPTPTEDEEEE